MDPTLQAYAVQAAQNYGVPTNLFLWQIGQESGWNATATNPNSSATGIAQFTSGTAQAFGINPLDPYQSLDAAAQYDAQLAAANGGNWIQALTSYGTLAPSNWAGGTSSQGYQQALAGAQSALGLGNAATSTPGASPGGGTAGGSSGTGGLFGPLIAWLNSIGSSVLWVGLGVVILLAGLAIFVIQQNPQLIEQVKSGAKDAIVAG